LACDPDAENSHRSPEKKDAQSGIPQGGYWDEKAEKASGDGEESHQAYSP